MNFAKEKNKNLNSSFAERMNELITGFVII